MDRSHCHFFVLETVVVNRTSRSRIFLQGCDEGEALAKTSKALRTGIGVDRSFKTGLLTPLSLTISSKYIQSGDSLMKSSITYEIFFFFCVDQ